MGKLFGTNGIRGLVNKEITPEFVTKFNLAIGTFFKGGEIFIGCDGRTSSPMLMQAAISGLLAAGCDVHDVGMAPTPTIQYAVRCYKPGGGVIITASHNPPEFNGIKVLGKDGVEISRDDELKIESIYFNEKFKQAPWDALGRISAKPEILEIYKEAVKAHVDVETIKKKHFRVVMDLGNGVGALILPQILRELNCKPVTINSNIDGHFPGRPPEPRPEYLTELSKTVVAVKADFGVAYDGDADRSLFCDEKGEIIWGDKSSAIIMKYILRKKRGAKVVTPISSSKLIEDIAERYGAKVYLTKVGSVDVSHKMKEVKSIFGCEENGGCFYGPHQPVRDGAMTTLLMLQVLAETDKTLSQLVAQLPQYFIAKAKIYCPNELKEPTLRKLIETTKKYKRITIDGVKLILPEGRVLIRPSGTEPLFRVYAEAKTEKKAKEIADWAVKHVATLIKH